MNSDHLLWQPTEVRHLFVVGDGYVGCELAAIYRELGSQVTIAEAGPRLLPNWDFMAGEQFRKVLVAAGIEVLVNERIKLPSVICESRPPTHSPMERASSLILLWLQPAENRIATNSVWSLSD